jgi:hypothetical protein
MVSWWEQILSFGAAGRVEDANDEYRRLYARAQKLAADVEDHRQAAQADMEVLVREKAESLRALKRISEIASNLDAKQRTFLPEATGGELPSVALAKVQSTLDAGSTAMAATKGLAAGVSTAFGAWALVGTYGAASTGTAIATLHGVAATNATLAWFGGGSLAAGGAGVAGGTVVLGGVVAVPILAVMAYLAHSDANKKIEKTEVESAKLDRAMDDMRKIELVISIASRRAKEMASVVGKAREGFQFQVEKVQARLYPWGWLSRGWKRLRKLLGLGYFNTQEVAEVQRLLQSAAQFAGILDQPIIDANGRVAGDGDGEENDDSEDHPDQGFGPVSGRDGLYAGHHGRAKGRNAFPD